MTDAADGEAVLAANRAFYEAFEAGDLDAMSDLWEHGDEVACTHPGWRTLHGWAAVVSSWAALFGGSRLQFIVTDERVHLAGDAAWVTLEENIMGEGLDGPGGALGSTVAALNLFRRGLDGGWRLVAHHGSPVVPGAPG